MTYKISSDACPQLGQEGSSASPRLARSALVIFGTPRLLLQVDEEVGCS
ncbi:hypothetical protein ES319_A03G222700v1 [Gossypium barbadense]|uniref:Uncharacterized protein n=2 Tax=Gossypium TaxID=3633 RepID=A0A5J5WK26_GOSBA|nr:hypothetical protein ES319_A03G222700v1 [Gossypium barbadense]TYH26398.1 hypothetical protein ES288_A03G249200v1 [Gossypium darwinii]